MIIPPQLMNDKFRFVLVEKNGKKPIEYEWNAGRNCAFDDLKLKNHVKNGGNYGILCGVGNLVVLDFDDFDAWDYWKEKLPKTFAVKTANKQLVHLYYFRDHPENFPVKDKTGKTLFDVKGIGGQVLCPGSKINGREYEVYKDMEITALPDDIMNEIKKERNTKTDVKKIVERGVVEGSRNDDLFKLSCSLKSKGVSKELVHEQIRLINTNSTKPLSDGEIKTIVNSAFKYADDKQKNLSIDKEKKEEIKYKSFYATEDGIYEQCYRDNKCFFVKYDRKLHTFSEVNEINDVGVIINPITDEEVERRVIVLPSGIEDYESESKLDDEIITHIHKWLDVDDMYLRNAVWQIRFSWLYDKFNTLQYIRAIGDTGTGKSRFLNSIGEICYKPMKVAGCLTPAVIFRIIDKWKGTLMIDEGDQENSDEANAFIKIMNCGYEKGMAVSRMNMDKKDVINFFDVYCPKVITTRKRFEDKATEARCMTQVMTQTMRKDIPVILTNAYFEESMHLRNKLLKYRLVNYDLVDPEAGLAVDLSEFEPRLQQVNAGIVGLFVNNDSEVERFKQYLRDYQQHIIAERNESFDGGIVQAIVDIVSLNQSARINVKEICDYVNTGYLKGRYDVTVKKVSEVIRNWGMSVKLKKINGEVKRFILFDTDKMDIILSRYVPDKDARSLVIGIIKSDVKVVKDEDHSLVDFNACVNEEFVEG